MEQFSTIVNILFIVLFHNMKGVSGSGKISIKLKRYENPGGNGDNGHCCDGRAFFCFGACDHRFLLCLDDRYGSTNMGRCPYGRVQTGVIHDADTIVFYGSIGGTRNPMILNFNTWPGSVKLKVHIEDHDDNDNDYVDYLQTVITETPDKSAVTARTSSYYLRRRTRLTIDVKIYCDDFYFGPRCDVYCKPRDDYSGHYRCNPANGNKICKPGWTGSFCTSSHDDCIGNQCQNGATCIDSHRSYICVCPDGLTGKFCEEDIDECSSGVPCLNGGSCVNSHGGYVCNCILAWKGADCSEAVDFCESNPCKNGAVCHSTISGHMCECTKSWTGPQCDQNVNECIEEPCFNNGTCLDTHGSFQCLCINGTTGKLCEHDIDECTSSPCIHHNATCLDLLNEYKCVCPPGITGNNCELNIDECLSMPCQHGATCIDHENGFRCACVNGTTGSYCETNINDCSPNQCMNGATCVDFVGYFRCNCEVGFNGNLCETDINECESQPCLYDGSCENILGSYACHCQAGRTGKDCEININECESQPCLNNGICNDLMGGFHCTCAAGYSGSICDVEMNECNSNPCKNNGTCLDKVGSGEMFEIQIPTTLDTAEEDIIRGALLDIIHENTDYSQGDLHVDTSFGTFTSHDGDVSTVISLKAFYKDTQLDQSSLQKIFTPDKLAKLRGLLNVGQEETIQLLQRSGEKPGDKESWASSHWYSILVIALAAVILVLVILLTVHVRRKRRNRDSQIDMTSYWPTSQDGPSLGFENVVYNVEHQPLNRDIPAEQEISEELTDLVSGSSYVANGRPVNSFKKAKTES